MFDVYENGLTTKDHKQGRRQVGKISADVLVGTSAKAHADQEAFLSNTGNKTQLINMLSSHLQSLGHVTKISEGDADTLIVRPSLLLPVVVRPSLLLPVVGSPSLLLLVVVRPSQLLPVVVRPSLLLPVVVRPSLLLRW